MLQTGELLGPYEIVALLGEGGMGEVYRARDPRLKRDVALKLLREGRGDWRREAQVLAALNHPHIAAVYGVEGDALVMELVEGPTLAERIGPKSPLPLEDAVAAAVQIAEALEYAHERGIVHRDLKPANIKLNAAGEVKVLDFGLAKMLTSESAAAAPGFGEAPTLSTPATRPGTVMGTAAYMSPEQARGKPLDRRTDIWAFGCVLFEMLAGRRAFAGDTTTDLMVAVVAGTPDWQALPPSTPAHVRALLGRCLEKDVRLRLQAIGEARIGLSAAPAPAPVTAPRPAPVKAAARWPWMAGCAVLALAAVAAYWLRPAAPTEAYDFEAITNLAGVQTQPALSPDGNSVAFVSNRDGSYNVYVQLIGGAGMLEVTHSAAFKARPAWTPDGTAIAYGQLNASGLWDIWEAPALGGMPPHRLIANAAEPAFSPDGKWMAYQLTADGSLWIASASGTDARQLVAPLPGELWLAEPSFSPNGQEVAFSRQANGPYGSIEVISLATGKVRVLVAEAPSAQSPVWSPDGRFLYFAAGLSGTVNIWRVAARGGTPEQITNGPGDDYQLSVSRSGERLAFATMHSELKVGQLDVTRAGSAVAVISTDPARSQLAPQYSPDGKHLVYFTNLKGVELEQLWTSNADGSDAAPLLTDASAGLIFPRWMPDGQHIAYELNGRPRDQFRELAIAGGASQPLTEDPFYPSYDVGPRGRLLYPNPGHGLEAFDAATHKLVTLPALPAGQEPWIVRWSPTGAAIFYIVQPRYDGDARAGLWRDDFLHPPQQVYRGWVVNVVRGGRGMVFLQGKPNLQAGLWTVGGDGHGLQQLAASLPLTQAFWNTTLWQYMSASPDGRYVVFGYDPNPQSNIGLLERRHE